MISRLMRAAVMRRVNIKRMYMDKIAERLHLAVRIEGLAKRRKEMKRLRLEAEAEAEARRAAREQRLAEEAEAERKAEEELIAGFYAHWAFRPPKVHEKAFQAEVDEMRPKLKVALHNIAARKKKDAVGAVALKKANSILPIESVAT